MSTETVESSSPAVTARAQSPYHPFSPLSAREIRTAAELIKGVWPANTDLHYKAVTLEEPLKVEAVPYLEAEHNGESTPSIDRKAFVSYYLRNTNKFHEAIVNLSENRVESNVRLGNNIHAPGDAEEIVAIERVALEDEAVKAEVAKLQLPEGTVVVCDPWIYGSDGVNDDERMWQCFLYVRDPKNSDEADSNHYALPLAISPVISSDTMKVIRVDLLPTGADNTIKETQPLKIQAPN
ncbi:hypothetical protein LTR16_003924, partial [Cryomyces antarcticus]